MTRPRIQFSLAHAFIAVSVVCAVLGVAAWAGLRGIVIIGCALGIAALLLAFASRDRRYLVVAGVLTLVFGLACMTGTDTYSGFGIATLPCIVRVVDEHNMPVSAAIVHIRETGVFSPNGRPINPIPAGESGVSGVTDAEGTISLEFCFLTTPKSPLFYDTVQVYVSPDVWVQVEALGYQRQLVRLDTVTGANYDWNRLPLPRIKVQLTRFVPREGPY